MCGIVSIVLKDNKKVFGKGYIDIFKELFYVDALRGQDSSGIICVKGDNQVKTFKELGAPLEFYQKVKDFEWTNQNRILVGHNRYATRGGISKESAHPFTEGHISLVHNGTLKEYKSLADVAVDSHAICHAIKDHGVHALEKVNGAFALVWYDQNQEKLFAARNEERPLWLLECDDIFVLSSEYKLAEAILSRNSVKIKKTKMLEPEKVYSFCINKNERIYIHEEKVKLYQEKKIFPFNNHHYHPKTVDIYEEDEEESYYKRAERRNKSRYNPQQNNNTNIISLNQPKENPNNKMFGKLKTGDRIDLLVYKKEKLTYTAYSLGDVALHCDIFEPEVDADNVKVVCYTFNDTTDFSERVISVVIERFQYYPGQPVGTIICCSPIVRSSKKEGDTQGPPIALNGLQITDQVLEKLKDTCCCVCGAPFSQEHIHESLIIPVSKNGNIYRYAYTCHDKEKHDEIAEKQLKTIM